MSPYRHDRWQGPAVALLAASVLTGAPVLANEKALSWTADDPKVEWMPCPEFMPDGCGIAVLHGNPSQRNADLFFKLPADTTAPRHRHTSAERMVLVAGEMEVVYDGQEPVILRPGTYAYGPAELPHEATCVSDDDCILFIAFEEPVDAIAVEGGSEAESE